MSSKKMRSSSKITLGKSHFAQRRSRYFSQMLPNSVAIFVSNPEQTRSNDTEFRYRQSSQMLYLTDFREPESIAILRKVGNKRQFTLLVRPRDAAKETWTGRRHGVEGAKALFGADHTASIENFMDEVKAHLEGAKNVYFAEGINAHFEEKIKAHLAQPGLESHDSSEILDEMRLFKSAGELKLIRRACDISALSHMEAMRLCHPGMHEYQLEAALEACFRFNGGDCPAYGSIVAAGRNALILHYVENSSEIKDGDLVLIDAATEYGGYASDITRTFPANGTFTDAQRDIYEIVLEAQLASIQACKPGATLQEIHQAGMDVMIRHLVPIGIIPPAGDQVAALRRIFMHGTSHWMGLDVHDVGRYALTKEEAPRAKTRLLEPGMVFTVEPGLYLGEEDETIPAKYRGIGIRIEDDILITTEGNEVLTRLVPKSVADIEALMEEGAAIHESHRRPND